MKENFLILIFIRERYDCKKPNKNKGEKSCPRRVYKKNHLRNLHETVHFNVGLLWLSRPRMEPVTLDFHLFLCFHVMEGNSGALVWSLL